MALLTLGTAANNTLQAIRFQSGGLLPADVAAIQAAILDDETSPQRISPGAFTTSGQLFVPNRGFLKMQPGDVVGVDPATGWPILLSDLAAAGASWVHVP